VWLFYFSLPYPLIDTVRSSARLTPSLCYFSFTAPSFHSCLRFEYPRERLFKALMFSIMLIDIVSVGSRLLAYKDHSDNLFKD